MLISNDLTCARNFYFMASKQTRVYRQVEFQIVNNEYRLPYNPYLSHLEKAHRYSLVYMVCTR